MLDKLVKSLIRKFISTLYEVHIIGLDNIPLTGPTIIISNHQSYLDAPAFLVFLKRDVKFLAYYKLFEVRLVGKILKVHHDVPIKDKDKEQIKQAFQQCCDILHNQEMLCIFPEGNLTPDGTIYEFKHGIKHLWSQCPTQIIPMSIHGFYETVFSRKAVHKKSFQNPFRKKHIWINIGKPLNFTTPPDPSYLKSQVEKLHDQLLSLKAPE